MDRDLERFFAYLEGERRSSPNTIAAYRRDLNQLVAFAEDKLGHTPTLDEIDVMMLRRWLGTMARRVKPTTIARKIASVRSFFRFLRRNRRTGRNPAADLSVPKLVPKMPVFTDAETMGRDHRGCSR